MRTNNRPYIGKGIIFGIIGGIIGGIVMLGMMTGMLGMMNLPSYLVYVRLVVLMAMVMQVMAV